MRKAKNKGTCQACGAIQKLPSGTLSKHGYRVQWNMFNGTCPGSDRLPYELSCNLISQFIKNAKTQKESLLDKIKKLEEDNKSTKAVCLSYKREERGKWVEVEVREKKIVFSDGHEASAFRYCYSAYGSDVEIANKLKENRAYSYKRELKQVEEYIDWQEERLENWKEKDLLPLD